MLLNLTECFLSILLLSAAWRRGLKRRFYDYHDRKVNSSTPNPVSLLRPWKMLHDDYLSSVESGKQQLKEARSNIYRKIWKQRQLLSES